MRILQQIRSIIRILYIFRALVECFSVRMNYKENGADGGTRTRTPLSEHRILSPVCLPFHHIGLGRVRNVTGEATVRQGKIGKVLLSPVFIQIISFYVCKLVQAEVR